MQKIFPPIKNTNTKINQANCNESVSLIAKLITEIKNDNPNRVSAYFDNQHLTNFEVNNLCEALAVNTYLKHINLAMTNLDISQLTLILNAIKLNYSITTLFLPIAKDDPEGFKLLLEETQEHVANNVTPAFSP